MAELQPEKFQEYYIRVIYLVWLVIGYQGKGKDT